MQTRWMMTTSAVLLAGLGLAATFLPQEIVAATGGAGGGGVPNGLAVLLVQIAGGLYCGFAMLNWSVRDMVIGGIYNRPIALGNLVHFIVVALALARIVAGGERRAGVLALACLYGLFAGWFASTMFRSPVRDRKD